MKITILFIGLVFLTFTSSCKKIDAAKGTKSDHVIQYGNFNGIVLESGGNLYYTEDSTQYSIVINTTDKVFEAMNIRVENNQLVIGLEKGYSIKNPEEISIYVSAPLCKDYLISGTGKIEINRTTDSILDRCEMIVSGSGNILVNQMDAIELFSLISGQGNIAVQNMNVTNNAGVVSGAGDIAFYGDTYTNYLQVSGTGNINSFSLNSVHANVVFSGSASARVRVDSTLNVDISGYGNVFYKGYPSITTNISGDGNVVDSN
ncbi:MAG: DUF2807 domain-containing protein [Crocinitomicaceae bacterium]|nr:DUF2807 domain-containing protein [Crocinitomicaceae bacterium]